MGKSDTPLTFETVLKEEAQYIKKPSNEAAALCISGGGIRSATFALGVLQGLADKKLLSCFEYLSTVSGGGYIGGWLSAWIHRESKSVKKVEQKLEPAFQPEAPQIYHLRRYSNYLTPKLGLLSSDTWTLVSIFIRNLLLNWLVLVPFLFAVLLLPRLLVCIVVALKEHPLHSGTSLMYAYALLAAALILIVIDLLRERKSFAWQRISFILAALFLLAAAILAPLGLMDANGTGYWHIKRAHLPYLGGAAAALFVIYSLTWRFFKILPCIVRFVNAFLFGGTLFALEIGFLAQSVIPYLVPRPLLFVCFASPLFVLAFILSGYLIIGLTHIDLSDTHREWLSSLGGWLLMYALVWSISSAIVLFGPVLFYSGFYKDTLNAPQWLSWVAAYGSGAGAIASAIFTAISGYRPSTSAGRRDSGGLSGALKSGVTIFILLLVLLLARFADTVILLACLLKEQITGSHYLLLEYTNGWKLAAFTLLLLVSSVVLSRYINVNKFSLHAMYRNRLIRAYLGASNSKRHPNPITGFDPKDNMYMDELQDQKPLHIINMALNLVGGDELAWQERKAESFTASAYHAGVERPLHKASLGYRRANLYGGTTDGALSLGTAMAISGAAANPNSGYASSPVLTFLMTLFNVRLGWWLGNPGKAGEGNSLLYPSWRRSGPAYGLTYLLAEAFGLTNDRRRYVNLSDGGHFENLALYEMIRRRCKHIVVIDGDCDKMLHLDDLGNAVRKCRVDFGAEIDFGDTLSKLAQRTCRWAKAKITYSDDSRGELLFLKPLMFDPVRADEPADVRSYSKSNPDFPHETTADQFFSESQFESYRRLGLHTVESLNLPRPATITDLFAI